MKKILPVVLLGLLIVAYQLTLMAPYHFYQNAISEGLQSTFLELRRLPDKLYSGSEYQFERMSGVTTEDPKLWEKLHFDEFLLPFPVRHPSFTIAPVIEKEAGDYLFGFKVLNFKNEEINRVFIRKDRRFSLRVYEHKIFRLPLFEKKITDEGLDQVWKDMFQKDFLQSPYLKTPSFGSVWSPSQIPLTDMVYDLFILKLRERFFPLKMENLSYWKKRQLGIIEVTDDERAEGKAQRFLQEVIYVKVKAEVYKVELRTLMEDYPAEKYRQRFLETIEYKASNKDSSIPLYASFKGLDYRERLSPTGLVFLYAAFSHQKKSKDYLRQTINFLERGKNDPVLLQPLYDYGYALYGTNFSDIVDVRKENPEEALKRRMKEEETKRREEMEKTTILDEKEDFVSEEEKIKFYLQRAKDREEEVLEDDKRLIID